MAKKARQTADQKQFAQLFTTGLDCWSSEDGEMLAICIVRREDWAEVLQREFAHVFDRNKFDPTRMRPTYVYRHWEGGEWFDGSSGRKRGKVWSVTEEVTEFPVYEYDLTPRFEQNNQT